MGTRRKPKTDSTMKKEDVLVTPTLDPKAKDEDEDKSSNLENEAKKEDVLVTPTLDPKAKDEDEDKSSNLENEAKKEDVVYIVERQLMHNHKTYGKGDDVTGLFNKDEVARLEKMGVIVKA